jgi:hypothetical protein
VTFSLLKSNQSGRYTRASALIARPEPGDVVVGRAFGVVGGPVAGVLLDAGDVEVDTLAAPAGGQLDPGAWDDLLDRGDALGVRRTRGSRGLRSRHPDADDRRRNVVELTDAGKDTLRRAAKADDDAERQFLAPLSAQAAEQLRESLQALVFRPDNQSS